MDFTLPEEVQVLRRTIRKFVEEVVDPRSQEIEETEKIPQEIIDQAKEMGLFGISIPEEYGGTGLSTLEHCIITEELSRTQKALGSLIGAHTGIGSTGIVKFGSEELKRKYLPRMARGELIAAFALTEPNAGSDAANLQTTAVLKGDKWILNGMKHFITNGPVADIVTVMAVTDKSKGARGGITAFAVEKNFPGFSVGTIEKKMGMKGAYTSELIFEDCEVPKENVIGEVGRGYANALRILNKGRITLGASCVGSCQKLLEFSTVYAQQRVQFGQPIASFQAIQWMLAEMATLTEAARWLTYRTAWAADQGDPVIKESSMVKLFASETLAKVADMAVQIHGGMGYMKEYPIERFYRDARISRIYEGTNEIQKLIISGQLLKEYKVDV
ncbi:acyl-CoA dehydrogenase [Clostridiales bacterium PH28_bin88]|nr:acyl-CoA dehydrogenase [Clostridiales bacterium PH28_bin88]